MRVRMTVRRCEGSRVDVGCRDSGSCELGKEMR